jgi:hypothetical protein
LIRQGSDGVATEGVGGQGGRVADASLPEASERWTEGMAWTGSDTFSMPNEVRPRRLGGRLGEPSLPEAARSARVAVPTSESILDTPYSILY